VLLIVGTNTAGAPQAYYLYGRLFADAGGLMDYCGVDGYYGTWAPGGPEDWDGRIEELYELTQVKVLVNEWGYSSAGPLMTEEEAASGRHICQFKKWRYAWGEGHTPEGQAAFVRAAFEVFRKHRDRLAGVFFYRWEDQERCWQCRPKPAFEAFRQGIASL